MFWFWKNAAKCSSNGIRFIRPSYNNNRYTKTKVVSSNSYLFNSTINIWSYINYYIYIASDEYTLELRNSEELKKEIASKTEEYTKVIPEVSKYVNVTKFNPSFSFLYQYDYYVTYLDNNYPIHPELEKYKDIVLRNVEIYLLTFYKQPKVYKYCNEGILSLIYKNMINRLHNCILLLLLC